MDIRELSPADADQWVALRLALWPESIPPQLEVEVQAIASDARQVALGMFDGSRLVAFVELSLHPHAIGCAPGPVAYLEGWYVEADYRRRGVGRELVAAAEEWGRAQGCAELASDTWLDNDISHGAHLALGFDEVNRLIHYRKRL